MLRMYDVRNRLAAIELWRRSCNLLTRRMEHGKTPTTPTISSIIAGVQTQEAVKILHGMESFPGKAWVFAGLSADSYQIEFRRKEDCYSHDPLDEVISLDARADSLTVRALLEHARKLLGPAAEIELGRDILEKLICPKCKSQETFFASLGKVTAEKAWCPNCKDVRREVQTFHKIRGNEAFMDQTLASIGVPAFDILISRNAERVVGFELSGDAAEVLGDCAEKVLSNFEIFSKETPISGIPSGKLGHIRCCFTFPHPIP